MQLPCRASGADTEESSDADHLTSPQLCAAVVWRSRLHDWQLGAPNRPPVLRLSDNRLCTGYGVDVYRRHLAAGAPRSYRWSVCRSLGSAAHYGACQPAVKPDLAALTPGAFARPALAGVSGCRA